MLECQHALFALPEGLHYLNCASRGPLPRRTAEVARAALERQLAPRPLGPGEYFARSEAVRGSIAGLVGTSPERVAIIPAVSYGVAIATHNTRIGRGQNVVLPEEEFPSDAYGWIDAAQRSGAVLRTVARPSSDADVAARWSEALAESIDADTAAVNLSTVHWTDGLRFDVETIVGRAREVGALVVLDGTQSLGAQRFDFDALGPDLLLCSGYKWLFGPYQLGFAVLGDRLLGGMPFEHHWSNREGSADVSGTEYRHAFRPGARRFDGGAHANDLPLAMLDASLDHVRQWGAEAIAQYVDALLRPLVEYLEGSPYRTVARSERCAHILGLRADEPTLLGGAMDALRVRDVRVSLRGDCLRISPHVYNRPEDVAALIDGLEAAVHDLR